MNTILPSRQSIAPSAQTVAPVVGAPYPAADQQNDNYWVIFAIFFFVWNCLMGAFVVKIIVDLFRGRLTCYTHILVCPHWWIGIVVPTLVGYEAKGVTGIFLTAGPSVLVPYTFYFVLFCHTSRDDDDSQAHTTTTTSHNERRQANKTREASLEDLLICKKVLPARRGRVSRASSQRQQISQSYRATHPKSDLYARATEKSSTPGNSHSLSVQLCAICLEEYRAGEAIAWSRNEQCHHVFHKSCILGHLQAGNGECPICRHSYHVMVDVELGRT